MAPNDRFFFISSSPQLTTPALGASGQAPAVKGRTGSSCAWGQICKRRHRFLPRSVGLAPPVDFRRVRRRRRADE